MSSHLKERGAGGERGETENSYCKLLINITLNLEEHNWKQFTSTIHQKYNCSVNNIHE